MSRSMDMIQKPWKIVPFSLRPLRLGTLRFPRAHALVGVAGHGVGEGIGRVLQHRDAHDSGVARGALEEAP